MRLALKGNTKFPYINIINICNTGNTPDTKLLGLHLGQAGLQEVSLQKHILPAACLNCIICHHLWLRPAGPGSLEVSGWLRAQPLGHMCSLGWFPRYSGGNNPLGSVATWGSPAPGRVHAGSPAVYTVGWPVKSVTKRPKLANLNSPAPAVQVAKTQQFYLPGNRWEAWSSSPGLLPTQIVFDMLRSFFFFLFLSIYTIYITKAISNTQILYP